MTTLIELQPAYLLHSRPFRDNSLLLDFLTPDFGRISAVSRGGRSAKSRNKSLLQSFITVQISLSGKSDLKTLRTIELRQSALPLKGERLFSAMYINEIIVRLFQSHEGDPGFFDCYEQALQQLGSDLAPEPVLRAFELSLLDALGYGIDFGNEAHTHHPVQADDWYYFQEESGFVKVQDPNVQGAHDGTRIFRGRDLLNIQLGDFNDSGARKTAKVVLRTILGSHLGGMPLTSRRLFR